MSRFAISFEDVVDAAAVIAPYAVRTPLLENHELNSRCDRRILIKFEGAQRTGSFKFRGAYNKLARLDAVQRKAGVVAWSGGNHAQGVAAAARMLDIPATIVMPDDAPQLKLANTRALGAKVVTYTRNKEDREKIASALAEATGATLVPSFDDPYVIAGQGTVGLEIAEQTRQLDAEVGQVLVSCGGGGLAAGVSTALNRLLPESLIYAVEPADFDDTARSLATGVPESVRGSPRSICDALLVSAPGALTFPINRQLLSDVLVVTDEMVRDAMRFAFASLKVVIEPGGAVALAAVLADLVPPTKGATVVVISGSNVDPGMFSSIIS
ncbi:threonine/serine dehydratase [Rhizobium leguminosarum]|nr:threonine/serine dehydratase [Rhizobium leguminosarum]